MPRQNFVICFNNEAKFFNYMLYHVCFTSDSIITKADSVFITANSTEAYLLCRICSC